MAFPSSNPKQLLSKVNEPTIKSASGFPEIYEFNGNVDFKIIAGKWTTRKTSKVTSAVHKSIHLSSPLKWNWNENEMKNGSPWQSSVAWNVQPWFNWNGWERLQVFRKKTPNGNVGFDQVFQVKQKNQGNDAMPCWTYAGGVDVGRGEMDDDKGRRNF